MIKTVENLEKRFGHLQVLKGITNEIRRGKWSV